MRTFEYQLVTSGDMSTASITSSPLEMIRIVNAAIQAVFTGAPVGTFKLQVSVNHREDTQGNVITAGTWTDYTGSSTAISAAGDLAWLISDIGFPWIRVVYTKTSGTGALNVFANGKGV